MTDFSYELHDHVAVMTMNRGENRFNYDFLDGFTAMLDEIENGTEADRVFSMLMGDDVPPRREFIEKHAVYANIDI